MDGIANVARQQQSQVSAAESQGRVQEQSQQVQNTAQTRTKQTDLVKEMQDTTAKAGTKIDSQEKVEDLVKQLNDALAPMSTNIKFGVDSQDVFYVSVIESDTNKMIRRFPAEQAHDFLPKMQEVSGILFDSKG
ncbi:flagellar protein FlaG [Sulfurimonas sp.]|uniref:flagellar protein FlaG n=1 Tax=Sulfurimonas sp. TaxID=2022749 RepID=UPI00260D8C7C|nr:flagellar protein FlaG [Sulfurimonas sp.]